MKIDYPEWFFMWEKGIPYITSICDWTKRDLIRSADFRRKNERNKN